MLPCTPLLSSTRPHSSRTTALPPKSVFESTLIQISPNANTAITTALVHRSLRGYKLCLVVYANGYGSGESSHVSVLATLMKGEHDQHLKWPLTGDIIIELLNWRKDKRHYRKTKFSEGFVPITVGKYKKTCDFLQFISHSSLSYNPSIKTLYLQEYNDRLIVNTANIIK